VRTRDIALCFAVIVPGVLWLFFIFVDYGGPAIAGHAVTSPYKSGFSFEFELCDSGSFDPPDVPPEIVWDESRTARIAGIAESNCGTSWIFGDYSVLGDTLALQYRAVLSKNAMCNCKHKVAYRIEGLPKKTYRVDLKPLPAILAPVSFGLIAPAEAIALIALDLTLFSGVGLLVFRQMRRDSTMAAGQTVRIGRGQTMILCVLLVLAGAGTTFYWYQAESAGLRALMNERMVTRLGWDEGRNEAEKDFAASSPHWYRFSYGGQVPGDRLDRTPMTMDGGGAPPLTLHRGTFIESYNSRMDELFYAKTHGSADKGKKK